MNTMHLCMICGRYFSKYLFDIHKPLKSVYTDVEIRDILGEPYLNFMNQSWVCLPCVCLVHTLYQFKHTLKAALMSYPKDGMMVEEFNNFKTNINMIPYAACSDLDIDQYKNAYQLDAKSMNYGRIGMETIAQEDEEEEEDEIVRNVEDVRVEDEITETVPEEEEELLEIMHPKKVSRAKIVRAKSAPCEKTRKLPIQIEMKKCNTPYFDSSSNEKRIVYRCSLSVCNHHYESFDQLLHHVISEHGLQQNDLNFEEYKHKLEEYLEKKNSKLKFNPETNLKLSMPANTESKYPCLISDCYRKYTSITDLNKHKMKAHSIWPRYSCAECYKVKFTSRNDLIFHIYQNHFVIDSYCIYCSERLNNISELQYHLDTHVECKYPCKYCDKFFFSLNSVRVHSKIHRNDKFKKQVVRPKRRTILARKYMVEEDVEEEAEPVYFEGEFTRIRVQIEQPPQPEVGGFRLALPVEESIVTTRDDDEESTFSDYYTESVAAESTISQFINKRKVLETDAVEDRDFVEAGSTISEFIIKRNLHLSDREVDSNVHNKLPDADIKELQTLGNETSKEIRVISEHKIFPGTPSTSGLSPRKDNIKEAQNVSTPTTEDEVTEEASTSMQHETNEESTIEQIRGDKNEEIQNISSIITGESQSVPMLTVETEQIDYIDEVILEQVEDIQQNTEGTFKEFECEPQRASRVTTEEQNVLFVRPEHKSDLTLKSAGEKRLFTSKDPENVGEFSLEGPVQMSDVEVEVQNKDEQREGDVSIEIDHMKDFSKETKEVNVSKNKDKSTRIKSKPVKLYKHIEKQSPEKEQMKTVDTRVVTEKLPVEELASSSKVNLQEQEKQANLSEEKKRMEQSTFFGFIVKEDKSRRLSETRQPRRLSDTKQWSSSSETEQSRSSTETKHSRKMKQPINLFEINKNRGATQEDKNVLEEEKIQSENNEQSTSAMQVLPEVPKQPSDLENVNEDKTNVYDFVENEEEKPAGERRSRKRSRGRPKRTEHKKRKLYSDDDVSRSPLSRSNTQRTYRRKGKLFKTDVAETATEVDATPQCEEFPEVVAYEVEVTSDSTASVLKESDTTKTVPTYGDSASNLETSIHLPSCSKTYDEDRAKFASSSKHAAEIGDSQTKTMKAVKLREQSVAETEAYEELERKYNLKKLVIILEDCSSIIKGHLNKTGATIKKPVTQEKTAEPKKIDAGSFERFAAERLGMELQGKSFGLSLDLQKSRVEIPSAEKIEKTQADLESSKKAPDLSMDTDTDALKMNTEIITETELNQEKVDASGINTELPSHSRNTIDYVVSGLSMESLDVEEPTKVSVSTLRTKFKESIEKSTTSTHPSNVSLIEEETLIKKYTLDTGTAEAEASDKKRRPRKNEMALLQQLTEEQRRPDEESLKPRVRKPPKKFEESFTGEAMDSMPGGSGTSTDEGNKSSHKRSKKKSEDTGNFDEFKNKAKVKRLGMTDIIKKTPLPGKYKHRQGNM